MANLTSHNNPAQAPSGMGAPIRTLRKVLGLTQAQLARMLFVRQNTVWRYEAGALKPSARVLFILSTIARQNGKIDEFEGLGAIASRISERSKPSMGRPKVAGNV